MSDLVHTLRPTKKEQVLGIIEREGFCNCSHRVMPSCPLHVKRTLGTGYPMYSCDGMRVGWDWINRHEYESKKAAAILKQAEAMLVELEMEEAIHG